MKFQELLLAGIQRSEIPLRFEPGAEEAVAKPVTEVLQAWVGAHMPRTPAPGGADPAFDAGRRALAVELLAELDGSADLPE
jgi:hypothetical protein